MAPFATAIQVYTVRHQLEEDFRGTMQAMSDIGYRAAELIGNYGGMAPEELAAFMQDLGMACCGLHTSVEDLQDPGSEPYAYASALNCPYVTTSLAAWVADAWSEAIENVARAAEVAYSKGFTFAYHHHAQELQKFDGEYALDILFEKTDPAKVQCEHDTYWLKKGGEDPVRYIRQYAGRLPLLHVKDMDPEDGSFTEIGNGSMDVPAILTAARNAGVKWVIYEQDVCKRPPLESARISFENLTSAIDAMES